jgi:hypothetical protein
MKRLKLAILLIALLAVLPVAARDGRHGGHPRGHVSGHHFDGHHGHHGHAEFGIIIGAPLTYPWAYPPPRYVYPYPPVVTAPAPSVGYIEQDGELEAQQPTEYWWYYCSSTHAYYPYVKECAAGWQQVSPQPPAEPY